MIVADQTSVKRGCGAEQRQHVGFIVAICFTFCDLHFLRVCFCCYCVWFCCDDRGDKCIISCYHQRFETKKRENREKPAEHLGCWFADAMVRPFSKRMVLVYQGNGTGSRKQVLTAMSCALRYDLAHCIASEKVRKTKGAVVAFWEWVNTIFSLDASVLNGEIKLQSDALA